MAWISRRIEAEGKAVGSEFIGCANGGENESVCEADQAHRFSNRRIGNVAKVPSQEKRDTMVGADRDMQRIIRRDSGQRVGANEGLGQYHCKYTKKYTKRVKP